MPIIRASLLDLSARMGERNPDTLGAFPAYRRRDGKVCSGQDLIRYGFGGLFMDQEVRLTESA